MAEQEDLLRVYELSTAGYTALFDTLADALDEARSLLEETNDAVHLQALPMSREEFERLPEFER